MTESRSRFHLAFPVHDLAAARSFYGDLLGCPEGRSAPTWVDFDLYGHQIVAHLAPEDCAVPAQTNRVVAQTNRVVAQTNKVDGVDVPARHFGVLLDVDSWEALAARLRAADVTFIIEPQVRFAGEVGEQRTCFFVDPSGNALEFKAFTDDTQVFARGD